MDPKRKKHLKVLIKDNPNSSSSTPSSDPIKLQKGTPIPQKKIHLTTTIVLPLLWEDIYQGHKQKEVLVNHEG